MRLQDSTVLVLGGWGLVGSAVCRRLMDFRPAKIVITSLRQSEAEEAAAELRKEFPEVPPETFEAQWGNVFTRTAWKDAPREQILSDAESRKRLVADIVDELGDEVLHSSALYDLLISVRPDAVIDCINTATAIAYQDIYSSARSILGEISGGTAEAESVERLVANMYIPQLTRHIQILYRGLKDAHTTTYLKIGTSGTGGMGLNIPFTHSEEQPSRVLLAKSAVAGAQTLLLFLMARTPDAPIVKEIKPSAAIAWKRVGFGDILRKGRAIPLVDMQPENAHPVDGAFRFDDTANINTVGGNVRSVFIDTGENGIFARAEFQTISALGQMEIVTPEEIADATVQELRGGNTGLDVIAALDASVMGPTYRGGILRNEALNRLFTLEKQTGAESIAFEMLGPPRLSKLLFEANIIKRVAGDFGTALSMSAEELSAKAEQLIAADRSFRTEMLSIGLVILLADGTRYLRGTDVIIPARRGAAEFALTPENVELWCREGWIDLRPSGFVSWQQRLERIQRETEAQKYDEGSSRYSYNTGYWDDFSTIDEGKLAAWIFEREDGGWRMKR